MNARQSGNSKLIMLVAVLIVAAAALLTFTGSFNEGEQSMSGTIVPAERYHSSQISDSDVALGTDSNGAAGSTGLPEQLVTNADRADASNRSDAADNALLQRADAADNALLQRADAADAGHRADAADAGHRADAADAGHRADAADASNRADRSNN